MPRLIGNNFESFDTEIEITLHRLRRERLKHCQQQIMLENNDTQGVRTLNT